ncbi:ATP-binding cassette domain-containing protein [Fulvivirgaceae bacterium BMA12]|uniref:ATP-binding cassette domain-containing protein n=1 Tax=Agaribacillus aureus TaxID=3051825 RepID=A0ABT8L5F9_9BACT|nr:ATP-binding cassette domain-containing protein [Fulvivirgaceae bacterium BMA12]
MIVVEGISKAYNGKKVVDEVSFEVKKGETLVLLGTSGSGKTTLLKMLNRLIQPTEGKIRIDGEDITANRAETLRLKIGYVIQNIGLFPHYTIARNIATVPELLKWDRDSVDDRIDFLLKLMGLPEEMGSRYPAELSGGQKQRVGLARALAADPPIVLLDEPFGALDPITRRQIQTEFKELETLLDKTMVLVTHDVFEAIELGDRICLMHDGKIQQIGTPTELIFEPANDFVWNYFKSQRFQLEMKVLTLRELLPEIEPFDSGEGEKIVFNEETSFLDTMERLEANKNDAFQIAIFNEEKQDMHYTRKDKLWVAFNKVKEKLIHRNQ